jgi:hypothetical protein
MDSANCQLCTQLAQAGVHRWQPDLSSWMDSYPGIADQLESFAPGSGHSNTVQIRRCKDCGAVYRFRHHSEYDVSGSWDEYYLWRLSETAEPRIASLLAAQGAHRDELHAAALRDACGDLREDAALLLWIDADAGHPFSPTLLRAVAFALSDEVYLAGNYAYRALLSYGHRSAECGQSLLALLRQPERVKADEHFTAILLREFGKF